MIFSFFGGSIAISVTEKKAEKGSKEPKRMVNKKKFHIFKHLNNYFSLLIFGINIV
jgi:hypothetical protein